MALHYAFNGDADGLCALQQLRLADPTPSALVTGVKRDIALLRRVEAAAGDTVVALDISADTNREGLATLLRRGVSVRYFDHHHAGELPQDDRLACYIDTAPDVCTSLLVDRFLEGRHRAWAETAAYGDSLPAIATAVGTAMGLPADSLAALERLGIALNYNAYGECVEDLHIAPAALAEAMLPFEDPLRFAAESPVFRRLWEGYEQDMASARALRPECERPGATLMVLPDAAWARRAIGVLANELMHAKPGNAIAILSPKSNGCYTASVRVPRSARLGADEFCLQFPTGGGRKGAGGVNDLPASALDHFTATFESCFAAATA
jgi:hypothetical protein